MKNTLIFVHLTKELLNGIRVLQCSNTATNFATHLVRSVDLKLLWSILISVLHRKFEESRNVTTWVKVLCVVNRVAMCMFGKSTVCARLETRTCTAFLFAELLRGYLNSQAAAGSSRITPDFLKCYKKPIQLTNLLHCKKSSCRKSNRSVYAISESCSYL